MIDTPSAAAFYHGQGKNVKSLFIPLISSSLTGFTGFFQQPSQQEVKLTSSSSIDTTSNNDIIPTAPTAPQQPTHSNKRSRERRTTQRQQQNSVSANIASTAHQRVMVTNMGNSNSVSPQPISKTPSASSSHHHRKKKHSNKINRKKVDEAITLSAFAVEEDNQGNHDVAMGFYLTAIENMLEALPIHSNQSRKDALKNKLRDFMDREGLTDDFMESTNASSAAKAAERENGDKSSTFSTTGISENIIQAAITSAVALKQSPIPDAISATVNYTMKKIQRIDQTYGLQDKAWEISRSGINLALEFDQQYNVHEKVGNALFTGIAAAMKAGIAYKDSPSYREIRKMKTDFQNAGPSNSHIIKEEKESI